MAIHNVRIFGVSPFSSDKTAVKQRVNGEQNKCRPLIRIPLWCVQCLKKNAFCFLLLSFCCCFVVVVVVVIVVGGGGLKSRVAGSPDPCRLGYGVV